VSEQEQAERNAAPATPPALVFKNSRRDVFLICAPVVALACAGNDGSTGPDTGSIEVTIVTTGDGDPDGYTVTFNGAFHQGVDVNDVARLDVTPGVHTVELTGVDASCTVAGDNPRSVTLVTVGQTIRTTFDVTCTPEVGIVPLRRVESSSGEYGHEKP
jgi:hypothetical protein